MSPLTILVAAAALTASLAHVLIDQFIGLFGSGQSMSPTQAMYVIAVAALYGYWAALFAGAARSDGGMATALIILTVTWAALLNGAAALASCPPPCAGAAPYQDLTHALSFALGVLAAYVLWRSFRGSLGAFLSTPSVTVSALLLVTLATQVLTFQP